MVTAPTHEVGRRSTAMFDGDIETMPREALASLRLGIVVDVVVKPPGSLTRAQGKAQRVRDLRPH